MTNSLNGGLENWSTLVNERLGELFRRAKEDAAFMAELRADPDAVLQREIGATWTELERQLTSLDDSELQAIAGGGRAPKYICSHCGSPFDYGDLHFFHLLFVHGEI